MGEACNCATEVDVHRTELCIRVPATSGILLDQNVRDHLQCMERTRVSITPAEANRSAVDMGVDNLRVGYPFDSGSHKMLWSRESIYQEANPEVTALARRGAA